MFQLFMVIDSIVWFRESIDYLIWHNFRELMEHMRLIRNMSLEGDIEAQLLGYGLGKIVFEK